MNFKILKKDKNTKARVGILKTPHGDIKTPSYVFVGTYGQIRHLSPKDIKNTKTQLIIANTFHLWKHASKKPLKFGRIPTMTDSGGFQVLSLAFSDKNKVGKFMTASPAESLAKAGPNIVLKRDKIRITSKGVYFTFNGRRLFLGPELSMKIQSQIGADIIFTFDHITSPLDSHKYNKKAVKLTDDWAKICLEELRKNNLRRKRLGKHEQMLFGIVQGGLFRDLRIKSAKSIGSMDFDGFGIGGSYTKKQIAKILKWIIPYLPEEKPRHLLGVGKIEDVFEAVESGIDTFDCVIPTREARHGKLYTKIGPIDIRRGRFSKDKKVIERGCKCATCSKKISRAKIRELIKSSDRKLNASGQRYALMHNMWFFNKLLEEIRKAIINGSYDTLKKTCVRTYD